MDRPFAAHRRSAADCDGMSGSRLSPRRNSRDVLASNAFEVWGPGAGGRVACLSTISSASWCRRQSRWPREPVRAAIVSVASISCAWTPAFRPPAIACAPDEDQHCHCHREPAARAQRIRRPPPPRGERRRLCGKGATASTRWRYSTWPLLSDHKQPRHHDRGNPCGMGKQDSARASPRTSHSPPAGRVPTSVLSGFGTADPE